MFSFLTPYLLYIKLGIIAILVAGAVFVTWKVRSAMAQKDQDEAVAAAVNDISAKLDLERARRESAERFADTKLNDLLKSITNLQAQQTQLRDGIAKERLINKKFYEQALPPGGYEQWKQARKLVGIPSPAAAASSPTP